MLGFGVYNITTKGPMNSNLIDSFAKKPIYIHVCVDEIGGTTLRLVTTLGLFGITDQSLWFK